MTSPAIANLLAKIAERKAQKASQGAFSISTVSNYVSEIYSGEAAGAQKSLDTPNALYNDGQIQYNAKQSEFISLIKQGKSCILIGAAGTGKTTTMKAALAALISTGYVCKYENDGHKHLQNAHWGLLVSAFTRRATANIRKNLSHDLKGNCITVHAALEFAPEFYEIQDPISGDWRKTMSFQPGRTSANPIHESMRYVIIEESSMLGTDLFKQLEEALPADTRFILLGDIQQLPPVFGPAILGYKMLEYPVIELTEVYRQALDSPIISLAHRILSGKGMPLAELNEWTEQHAAKGLSFHPIKKKLHAEHILPRIANFLKAEIANRNLDFETDTVLIPFNKGLGTLEMNKEIAQYLGQTRDATVFEIISGYMKHYLAVGDKVLYEKEDAEIISIHRNALYFGAKRPKQESKTLDRWGFDSSNSSSSNEFDLDSDDFALVNVDAILSSLNETEDEKQERKNEASHTITLRMKEDGEEFTISKAAEINALLLGYCLTIFKAQGCEWRKVYCIFHQSHATLINRECLYTAVTRAKEELYIICEQDTFMKGIQRQKCPGNTIEEKAEYFKGRLDREGGY